MLLPLGDEEAGHAGSCVGGRLSLACLCAWERHPPAWLGACAASGRAEHASLHRQPGPEGSSGM